MARAINVEFDVSHVECGDADDLARSFLRIWQKSRGAMTPDLEPISSHLVLLDGTEGAPDDVPDLICCGPNALSSRVFGKNWSEHPEKARALLSKEYRELCSKSYRKAANQTEAVFDLIHTSMHVGQDPHLVAYQRLILPFYEGGTKFLLCYSHQLSQDLFQEYPEPAATLHDDRILKSTNQYIQRSRALFPTSTP